MMGNLLHHYSAGVVGNLLVHYLSSQLLFMHVLTLWETYMCAPVLKDEEHL